ncbi:MAG: hypothetical protein GY865_07005 [candidate division Zixibacteria bacterium]|nr:hypothetical protein [candidate division Zixibacteria bacterium]
MVRNNASKLIYVVLILFLCFSSPFAQQIKNNNNALYDNYLLDNEALEKYSGGYYVINETDSIKWQKPTVAFFKSMLIPGWGQLGNRQYKKAAIVITGEAILIGTLVHYYKTTSDAKKAFDLASLTEDNVLIGQTFDTFDKAKENRNLFTWITGAVIFWSMFDAYVDAHMAHFPKYDKKISLKIDSDSRERIDAVVALKF